MDVTPTILEGNERRSTDLRFIDGPAIEQALTPRAAVKAMESFLSAGFDPEHDAPRTRVDTSAGQFLQMPSTFGTYVGTKLLTITPENSARAAPVIQGLYALFGGQEQRPLAVLDGLALTNLRTSAVSAMGAMLLAPKGKKRLVVFGTGVQAWEHIKAFDDLFDLAEVHIVGRSRAAAQALVGRARIIGLDAHVRSVDAVREADFIVCCTAASDPLFDGSMVTDSAVVIAMGSHEPGSREVDDALMSRSTVYVESVDSALREAGDVIQAIAAGAIADSGQLVTLADLVLGRAAACHDRPAVFKSTGMPWEDLAVATAVFEALA